MSALRRRVLGPLAAAGGAVALGALLFVAGPHRSDLPRSWGGVSSWVSADPQAALAAVVGVAAWACLLWLCAGTLVAALSALPGAAGRGARTLARLMLPGIFRRLVEITLGVSLVAGVAAPAFAAGTPTVAPSGTAPAGGGIAVTQLTPRPGTPSAATTTTGWPDLDMPRSVSPSTSPSAPAASGSPSAPAASGSPTSAASAPAASASASASAGPIASGPTPLPGWPDLDAARAAAITTTAPSPRATTPGSPTAGPPNAGSPTAGTPTAAQPTPTPANPGPSPSPSATGGWPDLGLPSVPGAADPITGSGSKGVGTPDTGIANPDMREVVVVRGDTLWSIAARALGPSATDAAIAEEWPRWWAANSSVIGPDPNLILPGQRLLPPSGS